MNNIAIIMPYYGVYPNYFNLWSLSAGYNKEFTFIIFTDIISTIDYPDNVKVVNMTFEDLKGRIQKKIGVNSVLNNPYKLCDYKPAYGIIFSDFLNDYDFWGHCDPDIIWGDLSKFISKDILDSNDKIYSRGHLTLYRNRKDINEMFLRDSYHFYTYKEAYSTDYSCHFDEWCGNKSPIVDELNLRCYDKVDFADIRYQKFNFVLAQNQEHHISQIFKWKDGKAFRCYIEGNEIKEKECAYIHLQKRKMEVYVNKPEDGFLIVPNKFLNIPNNLTKKEILKFSKNKPFYYLPIKLKIVKSKLKTGALQQRIYRYCKAKRLKKGNI